MWPIHSLDDGVISQLDLKRHHLALIVHEVIDHDGLTKREIRDITGLSWGLVSRGVNDLESRGYFDCSSIRKKPGSGRSAFDYTISGKRYASIGISIEADRILGCSLTLKREPISSLEKPITNLDKDQVLSLAFFLADSLFADSQKKGRFVIGFGISCPGFVDVANGTIESIPGIAGFDKGGLPIVQLFEKRYQTPARIERNAVCSLFEEFTKRDLGDTGLVYLDRDVNFSVLLDRTIMMSGRRYDIGHFAVNPTELEESHGDCGRLSDYASMDGISKRAGAPIETILAHPENYQKYFDDCGFYLGVAIYNVYLTFRFSEVILTGRLAEYSSLFKKALVDSFQRLLSEKSLPSPLLSSGAKTNPAEAAAYVGIDAGLESSLV